MMQLQLSFKVNMCSFTYGLNVLHRGSSNCGFDAMLSLKDNIFASSNDVISGGLISHRADVVPKLRYA